MWAGSEPVLPAYLGGMVLAREMGRDNFYIRRLRTLTIGFLTPFYFLRAGSLVSLPALMAAPLVFLALKGQRVYLKNREAGIVAPIGLRVNPELDLHAAHEYIKTGEKGHKFGIPFDDVVRVARVAAASKNMKLLGLDMHSVETVLPDRINTHHAIRQRDRGPRRFQ